MIDENNFFKRPESQGGEWVLAQQMKILKEFTTTTTTVISEDNRKLAS